MSLGRNILKIISKKLEEKNICFTTNQFLVCTDLGHLLWRIYYFEAEIRRIRSKELHFYCILKRNDIVLDLMKGKTEIAISYQNNYSSLVQWILKYIVLKFSFVKNVKV